MYVDMHLPPLKITYLLRNDLYPHQIYEKIILALLKCLRNKPGFPPWNTGGWEKENQETVWNFSRHPKAARSFFIQTRKTCLRKGISSDVFWKPQTSINHSVQWQASPPFCRSTLVKPLFLRVYKYILRPTPPMHKRKH